MVSSIKVMLFMLSAFKVEDATDEVNETLEETAEVT